MNFSQANPGCVILQRFRLRPLLWFPVCPAGSVAISPFSLQIWCHPGRHCHGGLHGKHWGKVNSNSPKLSLIYNLKIVYSRVFQIQRTNYATIFWIIESKFHSSFVSALDPSGRELFSPVPIDFMAGKANEYDKYRWEFYEEHKVSTA